MKTNRAPRIALIGCGRWGKNIARVLSELGALQLVVDPAADKIADYVGSLGAKVSANIDDAFDASIDGVAIAAPAVDHYRFACRALTSGKAVFVEKPLALDLDEASELSSLADAAKLPLMVGHLLQYHPAFVRLKEVIAAGEIGDVRHISSNRLNPGAIRTEENALWSMAPHDFSMVLGIAESEPVSVEALAVRVVNPTVPDQYSVQMRFSEKLTAQVNVSWLSPFKEHKLVVLGSKGAIIFEDTHAERDRKLVIYRNYVDQSGTAPAFLKGLGEPVNWPPLEPLHQEMSAFLSAVSSGNTSRTGPAEAIPVLRLLHRATAAAGQ
jgi:UDP-2-acetamido-3-amino-2,3-dideoxy-glucuronate N-acetyltransferase